MEPGGYRRAKYPDGWTWEATTPNGLMGNLKNHEVTEHNDGTITVSPSILVDHTPDKTWHGWLRAGEWSEA